ncbi:IS4 family transposase [Variovorax sp. WS11]|uniref:IS4 family transposase n=1 Tax=Variovorax sp. WS11 TaxID=1105204 RepID=UPI000D0D3C3D|nr:IS4 family transposase [Variovorax sp. WS11]NDZ12728.1 IS4 family transposase [Variovorax sp. WS11]NDZ16986.1 IS4 family transposase [Variovorax sp. WS11]NDZ17745.1 IS4 family transposase [Variovorax sp. WS11]NDZ19000.1 IS4 family transposase [Variovorax sp. WS11]PSL78937.1 IS4 family transposase [Variovorax sp. WS11]
MDRKARSDLHQRRRGIQRRARTTEAVEFFNILTSPQLLETTEALLPEHRERLYPPTVTLSMFMRQTLEADGSCQKAVNGWAAQRAADGLSACSVRTGAYCKARQRLPLEMVTALTQQTGRELSAKALAPWKWRGRAVKLVDGTGLSMPDTPENQAVYPQPSTQAPGVGFPLARLVAVICLATGAALDAAIGPYSGKGSGELALVRRLLEGFGAGDVMLADALYCNYFLIAALLDKGVDVVFEQHGARITDFRRGQQLGTRDHIVCWPRPARPEWMTHEQYARVPEDIMLREAKVGHQVLVTTLLEPREVSKSDLSALYARRWNVELDLRNLKTTTGMEVLSCQTPQMNEKQMWVHLLAYNVIRLLMAQAACKAGVDPRGLSFKHTVQLWTEWTTRGLCAAKDNQRLFALIAQSKVGHRPGRIEPRMRKRRPKPYPWLKTPREQARRHVQRHGHACRPK